MPLKQKYQVSIVGLNDKVDKLAQQLEDLVIDIVEENRFKASVLTQMKWRTFILCPSFFCYIAVDYKNDFNSNIKDWLLKHLLRRKQSSSRDPER